MDMLRNITAGSAAASNPLLKSLLGPNASDADYKALAEEAESVWKMMDNLAEQDPEAYQAFVKETAKAAREEVERSRDPHVEGLSPALILEAQAREAGEQPAAAGPTGLARVVTAGQAVARMHIWAANDASGVGVPTVNGQRVFPQQSSWSGMVVPVAEYKAATTRPGPLPVHHFHVACHASAVRMCVAGEPPGFPAAFLEAVSQFVEAEYRVQVSRTVRTLQVHREAVSEAELKVLVKKHDEVGRTAAGGSGSGSEPAGPASEPTGAASALPEGLLDELRSLGTAPTKASQRTTTVAANGKSPATKKALIEELD